LRQHLYFCTSKASKLSTCEALRARRYVGITHRLQQLLRRQYFVCSCQYLCFCTSKLHYVGITHRLQQLFARQYLYFCTSKAALLYLLFQTIARASVGRGPQHTSAYVSICQHMSAYVSIRPFVPAVRDNRASKCWPGACTDRVSALKRIRQHTSAYVSIRQHTSACRGPALTEFAP
jgi:hypothetical protein